MFTAHKMRREGRRLARRLRQSILHDPDWKIGNEVSYWVGASSIARTQFRVVLAPRRFRVFDQVNLYYRGQEIWLPLFARIRLRNAVRLWLIAKARDAWEMAEGFEADA